jgi:hypothetical protein
LSLLSAHPPLLSCFWVTFAGVDMALDIAW